MRLRAAQSRRRSIQQDADSARLGVRECSAVQQITGRYCWGRGWIPASHLFKNGNLAIALNELRTDIRKIG